MDLALQAGPFAMKISLPAPRVISDSAALTSAAAAHGKGTTEAGFACAGSMLATAAGSLRRKPTTPMA